MTGQPVLLLTAWHLPSMRHMPLAFWRLRRLERDCRAASGCTWVHRWVSRRSLLLTSHWDSPESARAWLASPTIRAFDADMRDRGARCLVEGPVSLARE